MLEALQLEVSPSRVFIDWATPKFPLVRIALKIDHSPSLARTSRSASSALSDAPVPTNPQAGQKRRRSSTSLSDDDEEDEDRPLASSHAFLLNNQASLPPDDSQFSLASGSQDVGTMDLDVDGDTETMEMDESSVPPLTPGASAAAGKSSKSSHMGPAPQTPGPTVRDLPEKAAAAAAAAEADAKAEVRRTVGGADEGQQVDRLATGVTVDAGALSVSLGRTNRPSVSTEALRSTLSVLDSKRTSFGSGRTQWDNTIRGGRQ